jgi:hypothetical protein
MCGAKEHAPSFFLLLLLSFWELGQIPLDEPKGTLSF